MKKLFYLVLIIIAALILFSCEDNFDDPIIPEDPKEENPTTPNAPHDFFEVDLGTIANENFLSTDGSVIHLMKSSMGNKSANGLKSTAATATFYIGFEGEDGVIDTLEIEDGSISFSGVEDLISLTKDYVFIKGFIQVEKTIPEYHSYTVLDTLADGEIHEYAEYNLVDTFTLDLILYNVFYDTLTNVSYITATENYHNLIYNTKNNAFFDLADDVVFNHNTIYYANNLLRVDENLECFYYANNTSILKVSLEGSNPVQSVLLDDRSNFETFDIVKGNLILRDIPNHQYLVIMENGNREEIPFPLAELGGEADSENVLNDKLYFKSMDSYYTMSFIDNSIIIDSVEAEISLPSGKEYSYKFESPNETFLYNENLSHVIRFSKNQETFEIEDISGIPENPDNSMNYRSMSVKDHNNKLYIHRAGKIFKLQGSLSDQIDDDIIVSQMAAGEEKVTFYGYQKSSAKFIRGHIRGDDVIEIVEEVASDENLATEL